MTNPAAVGRLSKIAAHNPEVVGANCPPAFPPPSWHILPPKLSDPLTQPSSLTGFLPVEMCRDHPHCYLLINSTTTEPTLTKTVSLREAHLGKGCSRLPRSGRYPPQASTCDDYAGYVVPSPNWARVSHRLGIRERGPRRMPFLGKPFLVLPAGTGDYRSSCRHRLAGGP